MGDGGTKIDGRRFIRRLDGEALVLAHRFNVRDGANGGDDAGEHKIRPFPLANR